jgi:TatD DNase family protein
MIDTHSHIYSEEFDVDRAEMVLRAKDNAVRHIILPNCDSQTLPRMLVLEAEYPGYCHAAIGVHPTSIKENYLEELQVVQSQLQARKWIAIGEIGLDLYWDRTFLKEQIRAFQQQLDWALEYNLPVIIHVRDSFRETMNVLEPYKNAGLKGIFHSFIGTIEEANEIIAFGGFYFGINGIVTFKNAGLAAVVVQLDLKSIVLETDSPYLTPVPHRGKRNESSYVQLVAKELAKVYNCSVEEIDAVTTTNTCKLFPNLNDVL